ncbi:MAG: hypothetical protein HOC74_29870 [Gemmatimonadetes bacterium]|jgi:UDP-N-acetylglucosamine diphosphorylase / glucose-1-phosphate thymidylyltransferase / UDP-N-acetylgalactosamine diphosphorylase / glucosamine-1-phosphate N-acetyltransferase / galactosamine-1-phosphate N-acetyltransferase|nr:hypothetical protein [Gemmatimonadota bacterium]
MPNLVVFEQHAEDCGPVGRTRPVFELRCGSMSLGERLVQQYDGVPVYHQIRDYLVEVHGQILGERGEGTRINALEEALADEVLIIDGAVLATNSSRLPDIQGPDEIGIIREVVNHKVEGERGLAPVYREGGRVAYVRLGRETARELIAKVGCNLGGIFEEAGKIASIGKIQLEGGELAVMTYPWSLIGHNPEAISEDFEAHRGKGSGGAEVDPSTAFLKHERRVSAEEAPVHIGRGSTVGPFVSFDVSEGPIIVEEDVTIESHCNIKGPAYVGRNSTLWAFADVKENCSLGPWSRVCGQIEEVIFQGYMHKFHVGFVGHSYLGEGVNIGDQTVTSNLKNDRTSVVVHLGPLADRKIDTGSLYCGSLIGDGAATGTNTNLTTGAVVEPLSSIVSAMATPKYVSGFLYNGRHLPWPFGGAYEAYRILVEERLQRKLPEGNEALFRRVYDDMKSARRRLRMGRRG